MAKLKGKKKAAFLRRMAAGRRKAAGFVKKVRTKRRKKSATRRRSAPRRRKQQRRNTPKRRRSNVAKKRRFGRARSGFTKITGNKFVRGAVLGLGDGAVALQITERFAPQFSGIAQPLGAFVFGGPIGLVASVLLQGGLGGIFGGGSSKMVDSV